MLMLIREQLEFDPIIPVTTVITVPKMSVVIDYALTKVMGQYMIEVALFTEYGNTTERIDMEFTVIPNNATFPDIITSATHHTPEIVYFPPTNTIYAICHKIVKEDTNICHDCGTDHSQFGPLIQGLMNNLQRDNRPSGSTPLSDAIAKNSR